MSTDRLSELFPHRCRVLYCGAETHIIDYATEGVLVTVDEDELDPKHCERIHYHIPRRRKLFSAPPIPEEIEHEHPANLENNTPRRRSALDQIIEELQRGRIPPPEIHGFNSNTVSYDWTPTTSGTVSTS